MVTVATAKKPRAARPPAVPVTPPAGGNYRCYNDHPDFPGRPCNKMLGAGWGAWTLRCPRCKQMVHFENPNDPIR